MRIAAWDLPPADLLMSGFTSGRLADEFEILRRDILECEQLVLEGEVDAALLPTLSILKNRKSLDVLPAVALSSWSYPFARLVLEDGIGKPVGQVAFDPRYEMERFLASLVLREHYKTEPAFVAIEGSSPADIVETEHDGHLLVGPNVPAMQFGEPTVDLGQEWYELAHYPMVWALFAAPRGTATSEMIRLVRDAARESERRRHTWVRAQETPVALHEFYAEELRLRLDDLAVASLTEFRQYLFFYHVIDDVAEIPFVYLDDDSDEETGRKPLL